MKPVVVSLVATGLLSACTVGHSAFPEPTPTSSVFVSPTPTPTPSYPPGATPLPLTPSLPDYIVSGSNACGDPYAISATTFGGDTTPLVDCPGEAGLTPLPELDVSVGDEITIAGAPRGSTLTASPDGIVTGNGTTYVAAQAGRTTVTIHGYNSCARTETGNSCPLVLIVVRSGATTSSAAS